MSFTPGSGLKQYFGSETADVSIFNKAGIKSDVIDELIEVPVPRPRDPGQFLTPEFLATKKRLEELIRPPELAQNDGIPMIRLTEVGDEVE